jgi:hypothetical protein
MAEKQKKPQVVVVYRKSKTAKKRYMTVFNDTHVDDIIMEKRKPLLDNAYIIDDIGVGTRFIEDYRSFYNIDKYNIV